MRLLLHCIAFLTAAEARRLHANRESHAGDGVEAAHAGQSSEAGVEVIRELTRHPKRACAALLALLPLSERLRDCSGAWNLPLCAGNRAHTWRLLLEQAHGPCLPLQSPAGVAVRPSRGTVYCFQPFGSDEERRKRQEEKIRKNREWEEGQKKKLGNNEEDSETSVQDGAETPTSETPYWAQKDFETTEDDKAEKKRKIDEKKAEKKRKKEEALAEDGAETPRTPDSVQERLRLFWRLAVPYFQQAEGAKVNFAILLFLVIAQSGVSVIFSFVGRDFYDALAAKNQQRFLEKTANFGIGLAVATPLRVLYTFQKQKFSLKWRQWMTTELSRQYYEDRAYYKVEQDREIDNPDQRLTEDVTAFTRVSLDFFISILNAVINLVSFSGILYSIYPNLFYAIFAYAAFGSFTTVQLGKKLVGQNAEQLLREADLRYALVRLRENAESIAFFQGEKEEEVEVSRRLDRAIENKQNILGTQRNLEFFTTAYNYLVQILPVLVVSPLYFAGKVELGVITQSTGAFNNVLSDLSLLINQFESISAFSAGLDRLSRFVERLESYSNSTQNATFSVQKNNTFNATSRVRSVQNEEAVLHVDNLRLETPDGVRELLNGLSFDVQSGERLLIMGNSGTGKSSLLRAVAGLWDRGDGTITRPIANKTMFLSQKPYCTLGTLRQQLAYPMPESPLPDEELLKILRVVQLGGLADEGLDSLRDWGDELSLGEQQRLAFARVLVSRPSMLFLDEATSALDLGNEGVMYRALQTLPSVTIISVGHRPSLLRYHTKRLWLYGPENNPAFKVEGIADGDAMAKMETTQGL